jgi:hypothetical protein
VDHVPLIHGGGHLTNIVGVISQYKNPLPYNYYNGVCKQQGSNFSVINSNVINFLSLTANSRLWGRCYNLCRRLRGIQTFGVDLRPRGATIMDFTISKRVSR